MSNLIKASFYIPVDEKKTIEIMRKKISRPPAPSDSSAKEDAPRDDDETALAVATKEQILKDAEQAAESTLRRAREEVAQLQKQAREEIEQWWEQRRAEDEMRVEEAKRDGFARGYEEGREQIEQEVRDEYAHRMDQAKAVLEQAHDLKKQIIQESEPFLLELSTAIARKIVDQQLTLTPEWSKELVKKALERHRMKGKVAVCVSPAQFALVQDAREELLLAVDAQTELQILPDVTVQDQGCVVRTSYGNIDARIDTQLKEIKEALMQIALRNEANLADE